MFELLILFFMIYLQFHLVIISCTLLKDSYELLKLYGTATYLIVDFLLVAAIWAVVVFVDISMLQNLLA